MQKIIRSCGMLMALLGLAFLYTSCDDGESVAPSEEQMTRWAEERLLDALPIDSGVVVSFVGPVATGTGLCSACYLCDTAHIEAPHRPGTYYLYFLNDHPRMRYVHPVRYACLDIRSRDLQAVDAHWWPRLNCTPPDETEFELIQTDTLSDVIFYYGRGGGISFPPGFL